MSEEQKPKRGFASMDPEAQRKIAQMGGRAARASGKSHAWTSAEARDAGRKGGLASAKARQAKGANLLREALQPHKCNDALGYDPQGRCNWCGKARE